MAVLKHAAGPEPESTAVVASFAEKLFPRCANPHCATGRLQLWRSRTAPLFEGRWTCSTACLETTVLAAIAREIIPGSDWTRSRRHRLPLGLLLLEQGWINAEQLQHVVGQQRLAADQGSPAAPLGEWLLREGLVTETVLTRALGTQWGCPAFSLGENYRPMDVSAALPHFLAVACAAVPLRITGERQLYLAFSRSVDRSLSYVLERMLHVGVVPGMLSDAEFSRAQASFLETPAPAVRMVEASSPAILARELTRVIEREKPGRAALVGLHGYGWLRMWVEPAEKPGLPRRDRVSDVLCTPGKIDGGNWSES